MKKRWIAMLLALTILLGLLPVTALAEGSLPFTDVKKSDWFYEGVAYVYESGLMGGTGNTTFSPDTATTRGMIVTILHRLEGTPAANSGAFADVAAGQYYTEAVSWASANSIVDGYGNGTFGPNDPITREQMAAILYRYAQYKNVDVSVMEDISQFSDAAAVSSYAIDAMRWAVENGIISGVGDHTLAPQSGATRAQVATILMRFCESAGISALAAETHTVIFDYNYDGKGTYLKLTVRDGETVKRPSDPARSGYSFDGWYTKSSGGSKFDFDTVITEDITLYAQWIKKVSGEPIIPDDPGNEESYTITFDSNGGSAVESQTVKRGMTVAEPTAPTLEGYVFKGWYSNSGLTIAYDFTTPVTTDIILYAKWEADSATPDDAVDEEDTEITDTDQFILSANQVEVLANSATEVIFYVNSTLTIPYFDLYLGDNSTGIKLYDNGDYSGAGDDIPNDGCYTGKYVIDLDIEDDIIFTAKAVIGDVTATTNEVNIFVYYELTDEQINFMDEVNAKIQAIIETTKENLPDDTTESVIAENLYQAVFEYLSSLQGEGKIINICANKDNYTIMFEYADTGIISAAIYYTKSYEGPPINAAVDNGPQGAEITNNDIAATALDIDVDYITYKEKALFLIYCEENASYDEEGAGHQMIQNSKSIATTLESAGFETEFRYSVTIEDFKDLQDYQYIRIACHGSYVSGWFIDDAPVICTNQKSTASSKKLYSADLKKNRIFETTNGTYWIHPDFFSFYYKDDPFKANIIHISCCKGAYNTKLVDAFIDVGAASVVAYTDTVYTDYDNELWTYIIPSLLDGDTVQEAVDNAKQIVGSDDHVWFYKNWPNSVPKTEVAECNAYGNTSTHIHNTLTNGKFDSILNLLTNNILAWSEYGDARSIFRLAGLDPISSPKMAVISSGFGSLNDETTSCIYQTFLVPESANTLEFSYDVVSEEPMEWVGSIFDDFFQVDILNTSGEILETLAYESVNTSTWHAIDGINFPGGDDTTYHTRWQTISSDAIAKYRGQLIVLRFAVQDAGDAIYDTAALVDSVLIK